MALATITSGSKRLGSFAGLSVFVCEITLGATSVNAVTVETGFNKVVNIQATWATDNTTASGLICTASGGTVSVQCTTEMGSEKVNLFVLGM